MAFEVASLIMAPDGDPPQHRASIKTDKLEHTTVLIELLDFDEAANLARAGSK